MAQHRRSTRTTLSVADTSRVPSQPAPLAARGRHRAEPAEIEYRGTAAAVAVAASAFLAVGPQSLAPPLAVAHTAATEDVAAPAPGQAPLAVAVLPALPTPSLPDLGAAIDQFAKSQLATTPQQRFVLPVSGTLTSDFGPRWGTTHTGLDIANAIGTPVYAVTDGVIVDAGPASGFGLWVRVRHGDGSTSVYGHIDEALVTVGQSVRAGDQIATVGNRGQSTGPHLHFEIAEPSGFKVDPKQWLATRGVWLSGADQT